MSGLPRVTGRHAAVHQSAAAGRRTGMRANDLNDLLMVCAFCAAETQHSVLSADPHDVCTYWPAAEPAAATQAAAVQ